MKLVCSREELSKGLQTVLRSVGARAGIPALSGVLIELSDTELSLTTTDLEVSARLTISVHVQEAGIALVPEGRRLFPKLTVEENLLAGAYTQRAGAAALRPPGRRPPPRRCNPRSGRSHR